MNSGRPTKTTPRPQNKEGRVFIMAKLNVNPTRMELTRLKKRLKTAARGHKLLKDKRDEMIRRFVELVSKNRAMRLEVEKLLSEAQANFVLARAVMGEENLEEALMYPSRRVSLAISSKSIMSVEVPVFAFEATSAGKNPYGFVSTSSELDVAISNLSSVLAKMIELAELEKTISLLAEDIEKTRRRVNALEHVMIPQLEETIKFIRMKLDENERSNITRLLKLKDMIAKGNDKANDADEVAKQA